MNDCLKKISKGLGYTLAFAIILAAAMVSLGKLFTPYLNEHLPDFERWVGHYLEMPVTIKKVYISWKVYTPQLTFDEVSIQTQHQSALKIHQIKIALNIFQSILNKRPIPSYLRISGLDILIKQEEENKWEIVGLGQFSFRPHLKEAPEEIKHLLTWITSQPALVLDNIDIKYQFQNAPMRSISLHQLSLNNNNQQHVFKGKAALNQPIATTVTFQLMWNGDVNHLEKVEAQLYAYLEGIAFKQWFLDKTWQGLQIKDGLGSAKVWIDWKENALQTIQSQFQIYGLTVYSLKTYQTRYLTRLNGHVGWKKKGEKQILAGSDLLIDLPEHLWPLTSFYTEMAQLNGITIPHLLQFEYLDLHDTQDFLLASGLLGEEQSQFFKQLALRGTLQKFFWESPNIAQIVSSCNQEEHQPKCQASAEVAACHDKTRAENTVSCLLHEKAQLANQTLKTQFTQVGWNQWESLPKIENLTGYLTYQDQKGFLSLQSTPFVIQPKQFVDALQFQKLQANVHINYQNEQWHLTGENVKVSNPEMYMQSDFHFIQPKEGFGTLDLNAEFALAKVSHLIHYLPQQALDKALLTWLQQAFLKGEIIHGQAKIKGASFSNSLTPQGQFNLALQVKDVDLHYAKDWPNVNELNGVVQWNVREVRATACQNAMLQPDCKEATNTGVCASDKQGAAFASCKQPVNAPQLKINVLSGKLLGIPLKNIQAEIPLLHNGTPVLHIQGSIQGSAEQALNLIENSPLGSLALDALAQIQVSGPLQLDLNLHIPLKKAIPIAFEGGVTFTDLNINTRVNPFSINHLQGNIKFSENNVASGPITGKLNGENLFLKIDTLRDEKNIVYTVLNFQSKLSSSWFESDLLKKYLQGVTAYQGQIKLFFTKGLPGWIFSIKSDLKGMAIHLPGGISKAENTAEIFNLDAIGIKPNHLDVKMQWTTKLTSALTFKKESEHWLFYSGELRLRMPQMAKLQNLPGLKVAGEFDLIDWNMLKGEANLFSKSGHESNGTSSLAWLRSLEVKAAKIKGIGQDLTRAMIQVIRGKEDWHIKIKSDEMSGKINVPFVLSPTKPIDADFDYLSIVPGKMADDQLDPKDLPAIIFESKAVQYKGKNIGQVVLDLRPQSTGVDIKTLQFNSPLYQLKATGTWSNENNKQQTHLSGQLSAANVAAFLNEWGSSSPNPINSKGQMQFDLNWPGAPYQISLQQMGGKAQLEITAGRIINLDQATNAKMGFGRILNILSVQSLSQVLTLNFKDLISEGYSFDFVKGDYLLKNGNLFTDNTEMKGSLAHIEIEGRIGLTAKDYDLTLGITPKVMGSIPVVAALAVNPLIGVAAWAVEKIASSAMSQATTQHYAITGTWEKPIWDKK